MTAWPMVPLNSICHPKQWPTIPKSSLLKTGFPVFGANGIIGRYSEYNHESPTVLITCRGATCGTLNVCEPKSYVTGNAMALDHLDESKVDRKFLFYALSNRGLLDAITGTAQPQITRQSLEKVQIPLPPLEEQKRIAAILDKADAIRKKRKQAIELTEQFLRSAFLDMFGDPITNPKGWPKAKLGDICAKITDGTHHSPTIQPTGVPYITAKHLKREGLKFESNPWYVSEEAHKEIYKRCDPKLGDVLYIKDGATTGIAAVNRYGFEFSMLSSLALLRPKGDICSPDFLCEWLNDPAVKAKYIGGMAGAAIRRLTLAKIKQLDVLLPPIEVQLRFSELYDSQLQFRSKNLAANEEANSLFNSLSQRAFKSEL